MHSELSLLVLSLFGEQQGQMMRFMRNSKRTLSKQLYSQNGRDAETKYEV